MGREAIGLIVMLNNYFHDLAVAVLFCAVVASWFLWQELAQEGHTAAGLRLVGRLSVVAKASLGWIILGGLVRAIAYREYEWASAAGNGQITALILKHVLLGTLVLAGLYLQFRLWQRLPSRR